MHGDRIGREQVWKWESTGQVQTSQDVGGDCGNNGEEERSRRWKDTVSFPGWKVSPPPQGQWTLLGLQSGLGLGWSWWSQEGTRVL